jgi:putative DNA primase/helicase
MMIFDALHAACREIGIKPPSRRLVPGRWTRTDTLESNGKGDAEVMLQDDGKGVCAVNWQTGQRKTVRLGDAAGEATPYRRDPARERAKAAEHAEVELICAAIVKGCTVGKHPYLERKGFPDAEGLILDDLWRHCEGNLGAAILAAAPPSEAPLLVIPGRIGGKVTTVQFITPEGEKKNILRGQIGGACHRIATGAETWVCEGIATAMSVNAALRLLGRSATVLCAFAASNVERVAKGLTGAVIAADHDKPVETLGGLGTGEFYATRSGRKWVMPPEPGDWNDHHQAHGLRSVALLLRGFGSG